MAFRIFRVQNGSKPAEEYVVLKATQRVNLKGYAVVDRTFEDGVISNEFRHLYFFPDYWVEANEYVMLHTSTGDQHKDDKRKDQNIVHHFYWGSNICVWNDEGGDTASLFQYNAVNGKEVSSVEG